LISFHFRAQGTKENERQKNRKKVETGKLKKERMKQGKKE